jgi:glycine betaine/proline transport system ATP-binding protein
VQENVGFGLELRGMPRAERDRLVAEKLQLVQLDEWADKHVHELSGGMQQRVGLARAFATDADVLLMDEPFSALDPLIREHLQDELLDLQHGLRKTIIFVSHDLDEALKIGNHIAILEGGHIVQFGRPEEIVLTPASDYVAQFVANMNPLNVLRGGSLMRPLAELRRDGDTVMLDDQGRRRCTLGVDGRPLSGQDGEVPCRVIAADDSAPPGPGTLVTAPTGMLMRRAIELHNATGGPLLLLDEAGRLAGVVGTEQILAGLLPRRNAQSA